MFVKMVTYDSEYGDASKFDEFALSVATYDELLTTIKSRFQELIRNRVLIIDRESGFANVVETLSGKTAESYLLAYPSKADLENDLNGITLANAIFYDPDSQELSFGFEAFSFWERFCDEDEDTLAVWGLTGILENQPKELDGTKFGPGCGLEGLELAKFLFELYESSLRQR